MFLRRELAEQAVHDLEVERGWYVPGQRRRISDWESENRKLGLVLASLVGTVEDFVSSLAITTWALQPQQVSSWPKREKVFSKNLFPLTSLSGWPHFKAFVDARNAFVHGGGALTELQLSFHESRTIVESLQQAGLRFDQGVIRLVEDDLDRCLLRCRSAVVEVDRLIQ